MDGAPRGFLHFTNIRYKADGEGGNYWKEQGSDGRLELNVRNKSKIVEIWLTKEEARDARLQKQLQLAYQCFHAAGYLTAAFLPGDEDLADATGALICYNRKRIAQLEVERGKK